MDRKCTFMYIYVYTITHIYICTFIYIYIYVHLYMCIHSESCAYHCISRYYLHYLPYSGLAGYEFVVPSPG